MFSSRVVMSEMTCSTVDAVIIAAARKGRRNFSATILKVRARRESVCG